MDSLRAVVENLGTTAAVVATVLRSSLRALIDWTSGIAFRHADLVTILSQSLTLFLLGFVIAHLRQPQPRRVPGMERT
ncbi:MAG: hypothetical protein ABR961_15535 [Thermoanaerobaculaceae bacterium]|jgi:hypothetical protein